MVSNFVAINCICEDDSESNLCKQSKVFHHNIKMKLHKYKMAAFQEVGSLISHFTTSEYIVIYPIS